jgi:chitinase
MMRFVVKLDAPFSYPVTVNYSTADGSATAGSDYSATQGSITFALGETEKFVDVPILGDTNIEGDETFSVVLSNASGASILTGTGTGTIQDDESFFSINDVSIDEGDGGTRTINFTVSRSPGTGVGATVRVSTLDGTAISNGLVPDFISKSEVITFAANETSKTFSVVVNSDRVFEVGSESFFVKLSDPTGAAILDGEGTGTIANSADVAPTIRINDASVVEGNSGTKVLKFTVALSEAADGPVTFDFATAFSTAEFAANGADFTAVNQSFTIPAGQKTIEIEVPIIGDTAIEADEVLLGQDFERQGRSAGRGWTRHAADSRWRGRRNDPQRRPDCIYRGNGQRLGRQRREHDHGSCQPPRCERQPFRSATRHPDHSPDRRWNRGSGNRFHCTRTHRNHPRGQKFVDIQVPISGDTLHEDNETLTLTVTGATHAQLGNTSSTVTITNDDAAPTLSVADISVIEGQNAIFTVKLNAKSGKDVIVKWVTEFVEDSADPSDFTHFGVVQTLTIPAGQTEGTISIATTNDTADEFAETFKLRILSTTENATITGDITATATIGANDFGAFSMGDASVTEGATGTKTLAFTVSRTASNLPASVRYVTSDGTAKAGTDYEAAEGTLEFAAGESSKTVLITINGDNTSEIDETFFIGLQDAVNGTVADTFATGKILNDEINYRIAFADASGNLLPAGNTVTEGDSGQQFAYFYVIREGGEGVVNALGIAGSVTYSTGVNPATGAVLATAGSDFTSTSGTASFSASSAAGEQRSQLLKVPITPDMLAEGNRDVPDQALESGERTTFLRRQRESGHD